MVVEAPTSVNTTRSPMARSCVAVMVSVEADAAAVSAEPVLVCAVEVMTDRSPPIARAVAFVVGFTLTPFHMHQLTSRAICFSDCMTCHECSLATGLGAPPAE